MPARSPSATSTAAWRPWRRCWRRSGRGRKIRSCAGRLRRSRPGQPRRDRAAVGLSGNAALVPLLGNHDEMMLQVYDGRRSCTSTGCCSAAMPRWSPTARAAGGRFPPATSTFCGAAGCFTRRIAIFSFTATTWPSCRWTPSRGDAALGIAEGPPARPPLFGQDGHRRPHLAEKRRNPRPRLPQVHRHLVLRRRLADGAGRGQRAGVAGGQERKGEGGIRDWRIQSDR